MAGPGAGNVDEAVEPPMRRQGVGAGQAVTVNPAKTNAPRLVDPEAPLAFKVVAQLFQPV